MCSSPSAQWLRFGNLHSKQARCRCIEVELQSSNGPTSELPRKNKSHLTMNERSFIALVQCFYPTPIAFSIEEPRSLMQRKFACPNGLFTGGPCTISVPGP